jgi:DNA-binding response OmpR family regulator
VVATRTRSPDEADVDERESTELRAALAADVAVRPSERSLRAEEPARVLVADDDPGTRELIAATLRASGYDIDTAEDGQEAVERVTSYSYDVILLDAVMPRMSGVDACRTIKAVRGEDFVPVALVFAKTDTKSRVEALRIGADGYVIKPFEQTELLVAVSAALRAKRAHDQTQAARARLARLRDHDELTGAHSFRFLHDRLDLEFERAEKCFAAVLHWHGSPFRSTPDSRSSRGEKHLHVHYKYRRGNLRVACLLEWR